MTTPSTMDLFGNAVEQAHELSVHLDGVSNVIRVRRSELLCCLEKDMMQLNQLTTSLHEAIRQHRLAEEPADDLLRGRDLAARRLHIEMSTTMAVLNQLHTVVRHDPCMQEVLGSAAAAHLVLHGRLGSATTKTDTFIGSRLGLPEEVSVCFATLVIQREAVANLLAGYRRGPDRRTAFTTDVERLRQWTRHTSQLRAPDQLDADPTGPGGLRQVRRVARPATPRLTEHVASPCDYETLSAEQLSVMHSVLRAGEGPETAAQRISGPARELGPADMVQSAARFGIWAQQSLLSGDLRQRTAATLGLRPEQHLSPAQLRKLVRNQVNTGAEYGDLPGADHSGLIRIASGWLNPAWGDLADPVCVFAVLYTPAVGAWYQIVRGDIHDLLGYTPMRQVHYTALISHVAAGGTLSEYAALQGRRYLDVLTAWEDMLAHAERTHAGAAHAITATTLLPERPESTNTSQILETMRALLRELEELGDPEPALATAVNAFADAAADPAATQVDRTHRHMRTRLDWVRGRLLSSRLPRDPAQWKPADISDFYAHRPALTMTDQEGPTPRAQGIAVIRAETTRLLDQAPEGAPCTELELLTELHHELGRALRNQASPRLPEYWRLDLEPGGAHHHVWRTFQDWPDIVTVMATAKELAD
ncbi:MULTISPECIES: hypothetical protein [unclassified Crossiella]|uniref:hypothetical protein n=1 Tax=unclassified Crossiella TaxID=2620835 RepID=UPI001FFEB048|nr:MULTISPECIES: hypothetical protein [unclassified Crossiella]MCK2240978.1 hypothetical protein [Crossiella sp. S99.2]MCK2253878.1 hypothetical protein [Crossiella sp. S99.1]